MTIIEEIEDNTNRKITHANELEELILLRCTYYTYQKKSTDSLPSQSTLDIFHTSRANYSIICVESQKTSNSQRNIENKQS